MMQVTPADLLLCFRSASEGKGEAWRRRGPPKAETKRSRLSGWRECRWDMPSSSRVRHSLDGKVKMKVVPSSLSDLIQMRPPCRVTIF